MMFCCLPPLHRHRHRRQTGSWHLVVCSGAIRWIDPAGVSDSYAGVPDRTVPVRAGCGKNGGGNISGRPEWRGNAIRPWKVRPFRQRYWPPSWERRPSGPSDSLWLHSQRKRAFLLPFFATAGKKQEPLVPRESHRVPGTRKPRFRQRGNSLTYKNRRDCPPSGSEYGR